MTNAYECCPRCGETNLDPRIITIGIPHHLALHETTHQDITTLKCQACGWLGEQPILPPVDPPDALSNDTSSFPDT